MTEEATNELREYLDSIPPGNVEKGRQGMVESLLAKCWSDLEGSEHDGMAGYKLHERTEDLSWDPPELTFSIERHGGTVRGSNYAEVQHWSVDLDSGVARGENGGKRVVGNKSRPLDTNSLAQEITNAVAARMSDPRLEWQGGNRVRIMIGKVLPSHSAVRQTLQDRRRRFGKDLELRMKECGWEKVSKTGHHTRS